MKTQQLFYIYKFSSNRIRKSKYKITDLTISQARKNGEVISIGQNQVINSILELTNRKFSREELSKLFIERKSIKRKISNLETIQRLLEIEEQINNITFIPEIISISMDRKQHYAGIIKNGVIVNGIPYVRLLCGAGHSRRNTVIFCCQKIEKELKERINNGRHLTDMVLAKNNAYFALSYSTSFFVSQPYFCVIPDYETKRTELVDFIDGYNNVNEQQKELDFNIFDGQGIISPRLAKLWASEMGIDDYIPSAFIIRNSFLKGLVCTIDFHKYSDQIGVHIIDDIYGNSVNIRDMDLVLTGSQFKGFENYNNLQEYIDNCKKNNFSFGITRVAPKEDNTHVFSNYQFLQILDLNKEQIKHLCQRTIDYFSGILNQDIAYTLLYLLGKTADKEFDKNIYDKITDPVTKALILNNDLIEDPYIINHLLHSINKKIKESYLGNLILEGNYGFAVSDPYAFMEFLFKQPVKGLLKRNEYYNGFWNKKGISKIAALRAPTTWRSECDILDLKQDSIKNEWYQYLQVGATIYNVHSCDTLLLGGLDWDGDLQMTTNQIEFIENSFGGNPIAYPIKKAKKESIVEDDLWKIDQLSFDSKIGYITNCSTSLYSMLSNFNGKESDEIIRRLKLCRMAQGDQIDMTKGLEIIQFPRYWTNYTKTSSSATEIEKEEVNFNNSILIEKRPYFFRFLYQNYNQDYNNYNNTFENYCTTTFGKSLNQVLYNPVSGSEIAIQKRYYEFSPLLDSDCVMNNICHYMESQVKEIKVSLNKKPTEKNIAILKDLDISIDKEKLKKMYDLFKIYKSERRNFNHIKNSNGEEIYKTLEQYNKHTRLEAYKISSNIQELANLAIIVTYDVLPFDSKTFVWNCFSEGILLNVEKNKQEVCRIPFLDREGDVQYLGKKYKMCEINIGEQKEDWHDYLQ